MTDPAVLRRLVEQLKYANGRCFYCWRADHSTTCPVGQLEVALSVDTPRSPRCDQCRFWIRQGLDFGLCRMSSIDETFTDLPPVEERDFTSRDLRAVTTRDRFGCVLWAAAPDAALALSVDHQRQDPAVLRRLRNHPLLASARSIAADQRVHGGKLGKPTAGVIESLCDALEAALAMSVDRVNSLCTCGVLTGGVRSPSPHCPVHAYEGETDA